MARQKPKLTVSEVKQIYENCITWALTWLNKNDYRVNTGIAVVPKLKADTVTIRMTNSLHCMGWPCRPGSTERVDILASAIEDVSLQEGVCKRATIWLNYFIVDGDKAIATERLRYDFTSPPQKRHPLFHVHGSSELLCDSDSYSQNELPSRLPESFKLQVDESLVSRRCQSMHMPSAFVNLPGLLAILASDHMKEDHWNEFMTECLKHCNNFPPVRDDMMDKIIALKHLGAWSWYDCASAVTP